jgi:hypothetical protein
MILQELLPMTPTKPLTTSERYARNVLAAWNNNEYAQLKTLVQSTGIAPEAVPAAEAERMDLIQDIGRSLVGWESTGQKKNAANVNVALALVRHLARCDEQAAEVTDDIFEGASAA